MSPRRLGQRRLAPLMTAALMALALWPGHAGATMVRLPSGHYANFAPVIGLASPATSNRLFDSAFSNLDYSGGPVMPSNTNSTVVWQPSNYSGTAFQTGYVSGVNRFFTDLAHDTGASTNADAVSAQYRDAQGNAAAYSSSFGASLTDTDPLPANGCPATSGGICLTDNQLRTELDSFLSAHGLPHDLTHEYFLLTPPSVTSCFDSSGSECSLGSAQNEMYCAYHSQTSAGYVYSNIPDVSGMYGCDPFITQCPVASCHYDNGPADGVLSGISHEHNESITDPQPNSAWTDWQPGCTSTSPMTCGGEIGDKCNGDAFSDPARQLQSSGGYDTPYNQTVNGDHYLLQMEWSNAGKTCADAFSGSGSAVGAGFTDSAGGGNTINFDAGASAATGGVAEYVWQFNDGPGQSTTYETTSPQTSFTFSGPGVYQVALTVMASDGTSSVSAASVDVGGPVSPVPSFTFTPAPAQPGAPLTFDAGRSFDPNPGGAITAYQWNFGDGSAPVSGASATHTYSVSRPYTVTLTVTGGTGLRSSISRTVDFSTQPPVPSFTVTPSSVAMGSPVAFNAASSTDPNGGLNSYDWDFGDGGHGSGVAPSHTYGHPGTYHVTLTVGDLAGQSAQATQDVSVLPPPGPTAAFTAPSGLAGSALIFDGSPSTDPSSTIFAYSWDFGDGTSATGPVAAHAFAAGLHTVTLTVMDGLGQSASVSHVVTVTAPATPAPPAVSVRDGFSFRTAAAGRATAFSGWGTASRGSIVAYRWSFGDRATSTARSPRHTYRRPGTYRVTLVVTSVFGQTAMVTRVVKIARAPRRRPKTAARRRARG